MMNRENAAQYIGHYVDDALNTEPFKDEEGYELDHEAIAEDSNIRLVGWQCGFEPMFVAVRSYLNVRLDDAEAEDLARDLLIEIKWFSDEPRDADYIL